MDFCVITVCSNREANKFIRPGEPSCLKFALVMCRSRLKDLGLEALDALGSSMQGSVS